MYKLKGKYAELEAMGEREACFLSIYLSLI